MNIIELVDIKGKPDIFHEYTETLGTSATPLVIDNGSWKCRVGWSSGDKPLLEFRNLIAKPRKDRKKDAADMSGNPPVQIGNDIINIEAMRLQLKTQFDRNVVTHFHNQEQILDYIFAHLSIDSDGCVPHPILLTEALATPNYCRQQMNELFFECYGIPALSYGIDLLFSWERNKKTNDALILAFGYHTTHVVPILDGQMQIDHVRRINVGGYHIITYLFRLMQMKYPVHLNAITVSRMETLLHLHSFVAVDYLTELRRWAQVDYYEQHVKKIQLPYTAPILTSTQSAEQKIERRKELSKRLIEINARRAKEKQLEDEQQIDILYNIRALHENNETNQFRSALQENKISDLLELDKLIALVRGRLERSKQKLLDPIADSTTTGIIKEKATSVVKPPADMPLDDWLTEIKYKRVQILKRKSERKTRRQDMAKRHTAAAQERMRIISQLARNERGTDEFGMNDKDWDVYKVINRDNDSDSEAENDKLVECENILRHYDPNFDEPSMMTQTAAADHYQLHVGVETLRAPELLFQPSMIGSSEAGLAEVINYVLKLFTLTEQQRLANNVYMTGGCAQFPGLKERLSKELLEMRPFQTPHHIYEAQLPELDAWLGARDFANSNSFNDSLTTRQNYEEYGSEYFKSHRASNNYCSIPR